MVNPPTRILTHKKQRKLTDAQVLFLLLEYVETEATYRTLAQKYAISEKAISNIVNNMSYRELATITQVRKKAQQKASASSGRYSHAEPARVPDATKTLIEVDFNSVSSINTALHHLLDRRSTLTDSAEEVAA